MTETLEKPLTQEEKRILIAKAHGYKECVSCAQNGYPGNWRNLNNDGCTSQPPDYFGSLDACHEMEKVLPESDSMALYRYREALRQAVGSTWIEHATAEQKSEAFGKSLSLW